MKIISKGIAVTLLLAQTLLFIPMAEARTIISPRLSLNRARRALTSGTVSAPVGISGGVADTPQSLIPEQPQPIFKEPVSDPLEYDVYSDFSADPSTFYYGYDMAYVIGVDVTNQVVTIVARGESDLYDRVTRQFVCSTGTKEDPTPTGTHYLDAGDRLEWAYFKTYECYVRYPVRIFDNYFFHSLLYDKDDVTTLRSSSKRNLGKRASHGCIRMMDEDVKWLSENCHEGTAVIVYEGTKNAELTASLKP